MSILMKENYWHIINWAADYVHTLKALWIKSNDNFLPNYQAIYKGKYLNLLKRRVGTQHHSPVEMKQPIGL